MSKSTKQFKGSRGELAEGEDESYGTFQSDDVEKGKDEEEKPFVYSHGLTSEEAAKRLEIHGLNCLPEKSVPKWYIFVSLLWQPMPIMIWLAAIIEAAIGNYIDMGILLFILFAMPVYHFMKLIKLGML